jgi:hypothetical protein
MGTLVQDKKARQSMYHNPFAREFKKISHNVGGFVTNPRYEEWTNHEISF